MTEAYVLFFGAALLSALGGSIVIVLGGVKSSIDDVRDEVKGVKNEVRDVNLKLERIEGDLHGRVSEVDRRHQNEIVELDRRVSKVEARCAAVHRGE
jgi:archaellum component FlaC